ncbi:uncharacterized protein Z520_05892 [Fonsecaea multimorphosa CBS 102226]|uniref:aldehyde dehydrogenase (NAD(+)) n=1 Tax=Fonsecaea multimorphosa CBS 102226 TaxID=1442371 RepID=A0A0D2INI8_9EURO|nr:uncharacterized protein Z520_05892 [Fonsecaea multimorphosa CBS 102226]KIX98591.1 hypothetical protein Z520_05892 [Fonsecaea multimorphosa CBS 102226]OAL24781.1 hypothetical protein AYO22_05570 [Fonsecaea multimorphosa]
MDFNSFTNIVDGKARTSTKFYHGVDPTTENRLWDVPVASHDDLDAVVSAAQKAFETWSALPFEGRRRLCANFGELYKQNLQYFDELIRIECAKPGLLVLYVPGIVIPVGLALGKIGPALMAGNCVIAKPSPFTPYSLLKLVELAQKVLPPGVLQVLGGDDSLGPWMTEHPGIQKISFTGSIATGKRVMQACSKTLKRVTLELGGNDASIICADVDVAKVAPLVVNGAFRNSGQVCTATKRIYVHESIYNDFLDAMVRHTKTLKVGSSSLEEDVNLGPVQNQMQYLKVREYFDDCCKEGYQFATGGRIQPGKGYFINPTIVDNPPAESRIVVEEPFGPIVPVLSWSDEDDVIRSANNTNTGLAACVWSSDMSRARRIAGRIQAGSVFINSSEAITPKGVFSGHKESGIGSEWGSTGLLGFCNVKVTHIFK